MLLVGIVLTIRAQRNNDPVRRTIMERADQVVTLPRSWLSSPELPPDEVVAFQTWFYQEVQELNELYGNTLVGTDSTTDSVLWQLQQGEEISSDEQDLLNQFMVAVNPLIERTSAAVALEGYTSEMILYTSAPASMLAIKFGRFSSLAALESARLEDCKRAMELAALPLQYSHHEPPSSMLAEIVDFILAENAARTYFVLADMCSNPDELQRGLALMNAHRGVALTTGSELWGDADWASGLIRAKAFGYPIDLSPQTRGSFYFQFAKVLGAPYYEWVLENVPPEDIRYQVASDWMRSQEYSADSAQKRLQHMEFINDNIITGNMIRLATGHSLFANIVEMTNPPDVQEAQLRASTALARYDLARVHLAQRLYALEVAEQQTTVPIEMPVDADPMDSVGKYLQKVPPDPFSRKDLRLNAAMQKFYSVGPDGDDDDAQMLYDVTNGTISNGDIWLERR